MDQNSNAILTLCSHLCVGEGVEPLEPMEWSAFAKELVQKQIQPGDLFDFSFADLTEKAGLDNKMAERVMRLLERNASLSFELEKYENIGISAITRADKKYPAKLKRVLGNNCPPIFYYAGDLDILDRSVIGYVGSRTVNDEDIRFTEEIVKKQRQTVTELFLEEQRESTLPPKKQLSDSEALRSNIFRTQCLER